MFKKYKLTVFPSERFPAGDSAFLPTPVLPAPPFPARYAWPDAGGFPTVSPALDGLRYRVLSGMFEELPLDFLLG